MKATIIATSRPAQAERIWKTTCQSTFYAILVASSLDDPKNRVRYKLRRWKLSDIHSSARINSIAWRTEKATWLLKLVGKYTPPRVQSAVFSTLWNRWTTARRYQVRDKRCLLCDAGHSEDSIEHYSCCRIVREILARFLHMDQARFASLHTFVLTHPDINSKESLVKIALLIYGVYRTTNAVRAHRVAGTNYFEAIKQAIKEGARGHSGSMLILDNCWSMSAPSTPLPTCPLVHFSSPVLKWRNLSSTHAAKRRRTDER